MGRANPALQDFVAERAERHSAEVGQVLSDIPFHDGAISTVAGGLIALQRIMDDGRRFVLDFVCKGETLSNGQLPRDFSAVAIIPSVVCVLAPGLVSTMKRAYPQAAAQLHEMAIDDQKDMIEHMTLLARGSVQERIAHFLLTLAQRIGAENTDGTTVDLPMTRGDIGDYLGLNTETVSRQFSALKKSGVIRLPKPDRMVVPCIDRLRERAMSSGGS